jgi:hypothetical protein
MLSKSGVYAQLPTNQWKFSISATHNGHFRANINRGSVRNIAYPLMHYKISTSWLKFRFIYNYNICRLIINARILEHKITVYVLIEDKNICNFSEFKYVNSDYPLS